MLKRYTYKLLAAATLPIYLGLAACNSSELPEPEPVQLDVTIHSENETLARATVDGKSFTEGDRFRFFFDAPKPLSTVPTNKQADYTFTSNEWNTGTPIYWDEYKAEERYFCAFLPYDDSNLNQTEYSFNIATNQSAEAGYRASDLLIARVKTEKRLIPIRFWHVLSKVVVNVTASTDNIDPGKCFDPADFTGMTAELVDIDPAATIDYGTLKIDAAPKYDPAVAATTGGGTIGNIAMLCTQAPAHDTATKKITATYTAIVPPQTIGTGIRSVTFTLTDATSTTKTYHLKHDEAIGFQQGNKTTINVDLYKNNVEITTTASDINITSWDAITANGGTIVLPN